MIRGPYRKPVSYAPNNPPSELTNYYEAALGVLVLVERTLPLLAQATRDALFQDDAEQREHVFAVLEAAAPTIVDRLRRLREADTARQEWLAREVER